jgi:hypothetical protein
MQRRFLSVHGGFGPLYRNSATAATIRIDRSSVLLFRQHHQELTSLRLQFLGAQSSRRIANASLERVAVKRVDAKIRGAGPRNGSFGSSRVQVFGVASVLDGKRTVAQGLLTDFDSCDRIPFDGQLDANSTLLGIIAPAFDDPALPSALKFIQIVGRLAGGNCRDRRDKRRCDQQAVTGHL